MSGTRKKPKSKSTAQRAKAKKGKTKQGPLWPADLSSGREILWRPQRFTYLSKQPTPDECVFCAAREKGPSSDSLIVFDNGTSMVMLNKYPYNNGHLLVLPSRHVADIEDLSQEEFQDLNEHILQGISALRKGYDKSPHGINAGLNLGAAAGAGIPQHLHYHIIPRWFGDSNFFPLIGQTKVISETLEQTYQRLLPYFE